MSKYNRYEFYVLEFDISLGYNGRTYHKDT